MALEYLQPEKARHDVPLLFIHGAGATSRYWKNYLPYFADRGWNVFAVNLRGHFPSEREEGLAQTTMEDYLEDVERVIRHLNFPQYALVGHSLGGLLAMKTAENISSVHAVVTLASAPPFGISPEVNIRTDLPYSGTFIKTVWGMINMKPVVPTFALAQKTVLNNIGADEQKTVFDMFVPESLVVAYQVTQGYPVFSSQIKCPKLVIGCVKDMLAPAAMQRRLADFLKAEYMEYDEFAHLPMLEEGWNKPAETIAAWLERKLDNFKV